MLELPNNATTSHVVPDTADALIFASIDNEAVADLGLEAGKTSYAVSKASDVMVAVD